MIANSGSTAATRTPAMPLTLVPVTAAGEEGWIERIRSGDARAFDTLVCRYWAKLCAVAYRIGTTHEAAEDTVQDLFARLWAARTEWSVPYTIGAYLFGAVRDRALEMRSRRGAETGDDGSTWHEMFTPAEVPVMDGVGPETPAGQLAYVRDAMNRIPERTRQVLALRWWDGLGREDVAYALGVSVKTVDRHLWAALALLRHRLRGRLESSVLDGLFTTDGAGHAAMLPGAQPTLAWGSAAIHAVMARRRGAQIAAEARAQPAPLMMVPAGDAGRRRAALVMIGVALLAMATATAAMRLFVSAR
jgi:RNA polymerase sigma-70 factor, ECF subfamily